MLTGIVKFGPEIDPVALPAHLAKCLRRRGASEVEIQSELIAFESDASQFWTVLFPFGFGNLAINPHNRRVNYRLSLRRLIVECSVIVGIMAIFALFVVVPVTASLLPIAIIPLMWLWFVGGNLIIGIPRFRQFVRRSVATAPRL